MSSYVEAISRENNSCLWDAAPDARAQSSRQIFQSSIFFEYTSRFVLGLSAMDVLPSPISLTRLASPRANAGARQIRAPIRGSSPTKNISFPSADQTGLLFIRFQ